MNTQYLIFLDIEGVLVSSNYTKALFYKKQLRSDFEVDPIALMWLEIILNQFDCKIVIISNKVIYGLPFIKKKLYSISKYILNDTVTITEENDLSKCINSYVEANKYKDFVIISTTNKFNQAQFKRLIQTDDKHGITEKNYHQLVNVFESSNIEPLI